MGWMDFDDPKKIARGKKSDMFNKKNPNTKWSSGDAVAMDSAKAKRNHAKAMEDQRKKLEAALAKEQERQRLKRLRRERDQALRDHLKETRKQAKRNRNK
jgi:hypothetical protein